MASILEELDKQAVFLLHSSVGCRCNFLTHSHLITSESSVQEYIYLGSDSTLRPSQIRTYTKEHETVVDLAKCHATPGEPHKQKKPHKKLQREYYPNIVEEMQIVKPKRILALGPVVANVLCPGYKDLSEDHGTIFWNPDMDCFVIPTYHFNSVAGSRDLLPFFLRDIERFFELPNPNPPVVYVLDNIDGLAPLLEHTKRLYLDIETDGLELGVKITRIGLGVDQSDIVHVLEEPSKRDLRRMMEIIDEADVIVTGHNLTFDFSHICFKARVYDWRPRCNDTMVIAHAKGYRPLSLKHLTTYLTNRPGSRAFGGTKDLGYLGEDILGTKYLFKALSQRGNGDGHRGRSMPILKTLHKLIPELALMHNTGVYVDVKATGKVLQVARRQLQRTNAKLNAVAEINWNSTEQVIPVFKREGIQLTEKTTTGKFKRDEKVLLGLAKRYKLVRRLLRQRAQKKDLEFLESYWEVLTPRHPFLHPRLLLHTTDTARPSCREPNL